MKKNRNAQNQTRTSAVIYCRVSSVDQVQNFSLETQEAESRRFCAQHGLTVAQVFLEAGRSAKTTKKRPEFKKMQAFCAQHSHRIEAVIVYNFSRFSRDTHTGSQAIAELAALNIKLLSVTEAADESPFGKFARSLHFSIAQLDNDQKSERSKRDMREALARGRWVHTAPIGYDWSKIGIRPDPERAPLITAAFERLATGRFTKAQVREWVTRQGLRTHQDRPISAQTFGNMMRNQLYAGWVASKKWNVCYRGEHPPIVTQEIFNQVQAVLDGRVTTGTYRLANPSFPLRRFVKCARCGVPLTGSNVKGRTKHYEYYSCRTRGCAGNVGRESLENQFETLMATLRPRQEYLSLMRLLVREVWQDKQKNTVESLQRVERQLERVDQKLADVLDAFVYRKVIDKHIFETERERLSAEKRALETEKASHPVDALDVDRLWPAAESLLANADKLWRQGNLDERLQLQNVLFPRGVTYAGGEFGTGGSCPFYETWDVPDRSESKMASPSGSVTWGN